jgi:hypothetical protein
MCVWLCSTVSSSSGSGGHDGVDGAQGLPGWVFGCVMLSLSWDAVNQLLADFVIV